MTTSKKSQKKNVLRHAEYYDLTEAFDELYAKSLDGKCFTHLVEIISSENNILLAYRNLKRNKGSMTAGTDGINICDLEKIPRSQFIEIIQKKLMWYTPRPVKRVDIPKDNGKTRPLGIPSIWDRVIQQCILQVLDPICEAKFHKRNNGFRPNRSVEHAIAQCMRMMQRQNLHYVVDIDIKGFFDNVNHAKLRKQMWTMGIRDKSLLCIISKMLKAQVVMPDGIVDFPTKGTPQGGVLSPLLANIVLNELDWWIASQWETMPLASVPKNYNPNGGRNRGNENKAMRKTRLKEMYIVRYADDFKIFCSNKKDADRAFISVQNWLRERLKLDISPEKSKVVNLKKSYTEFLGFKLKVVPSKGKYKVRSHLSDKAKAKTKKELMVLVKALEHPKDSKEVHSLVNKFNATVIGKHQYFKVATNVYMDFDEIAYQVNNSLKVRLKGRIKKHGTLRKGYIKDVYGKSQQLRFVDDYPIAPIAYVQTKNALHLKRGTCNYTIEGRKLIHKPLGVDLSVLRDMMVEEGQSYSVEFMDNRISLYATQYGKCAVTSTHLERDDIHCHHKIPRSNGGTDRFENLVIIHKDIHRLIHAVNSEIIEKYRSKLNLTVEQLMKVNRFRKTANLDMIAV